MRTFFENDLSFLLFRSWKIHETLKIFYWRRIYQLLKCIIVLLKNTMLITEINYKGFFQSIIRVWSRRRRRLIFNMDIYRFRRTIYHRRDLFIGYRTELRSWFFSPLLYDKWLYDIKSLSNKLFFSVRRIR